VVTVESASEISATPVAQTVTLVGTNTYQSVITPGFGVHSIKVVVSDTSANAAIVGGNRIGVGWPTPGAIALYIDNNLPAPTVDPASGATITNGTPVIFTIDYVAESVEFGLAPGATLTNDSSLVATDLDIHNTVTVATVTLDGTDVSFGLSTSDNITFTLSLPVVTAGAHNLRVIASDLAGNVHDSGNLAYTLSGAPPTNTDLAITKTATPSPVNAGQTVVYGLTVSNTGPADTSNVVVTDVLPSQVTFISAISAQGTCAQSTGTVTCNLGTVANGGSVAISVAVTAPASGQTISNTSTVTATEPDGTPTNNTSTLATVVAASADLGITKTASPASAALNQQVIYTVAVLNNGPSTANNVVVTDTLPGTASFVSAVASQGSCSESSGVVTCTIGTLADAATATVTVRVNAPGTPQSLTNTASVAATEGDPSGGNNSATVVTSVAQSADLAISKSSDIAVLTSLPFTYTITVVNNGPATATAITVVDDLPTGSVFVSASAGCTAAGQTVTCTVSSLANGASTALSIVATAPAVPGNIINTASITASTPSDPVSANNTATAVTQVATVLGVPAIGVWGLIGVLLVFAGVVIRARRRRPVA
jgi:uncharacterized repeat protein (TIGR01451 family)